MQFFRVSGNRILKKISTELNSLKTSWESQQGSWPENSVFRRPMCGKYSESEDHPRKRQQAPYLTEKQAKTQGRRLWTLARSLMSAANQRVVMDDECYFTFADDNAPGNKGFYASGSVDDVPQKIRFCQKNKFPKMMLWIAVSTLGICLGTIFLQKWRCLKRRTVPRRVHKEATDAVHRLQTREERSALLARLGLVSLREADSISSRGGRHPIPRFLQIRLRHESRDKYVIHISKTAFKNVFFFKCLITMWPLWGSRTSHVVNGPPLLRWGATYWYVAIEVNLFPNFKLLTTHWYWIIF